MMETSMMNAMCRCCASEGVFKDVKSTYHWMGEEEIYADMLKECFDLTLFTPDDGEDGGICEVCITQLRNAVNFKKQVLHTEDQFKKHVQNKLFKPNIVKVELEGEDGESDDNNASAEEGYSGTEYEIPIKTEVPEEPKPKKRAAAAKATTSRAKKAKIEVGEPSTKRDQRKVTNNINMNHFESAMLLVVEDPEDTINTTELSEESKKNQKRLSKEELTKHHQNITEILLCTNATLILRYGRTGYMCSYCPKEFPEPADLKTHILETHMIRINPIPDYIYNLKMSEYVVKIDITGLCCLLCAASIESLDELLEHLSIEHEKFIHTDINNHICAFKFDSDQLTCCLCLNVFDKFKTLYEHMHKHYRNYICDECDSGYVFQGCLTRHKHTHRKGIFPCSHCPKVYGTRLSVYHHILTKHNHVAMHKCGYCDDSFSEYFAKERHLAEVHGVNTEKKCTVCDSTFSCEKYLKRHVKQNHLLDRRHQCTVCDMKFFSAHQLSQHMVKHTGSKPFQCGFCFKSFGRKCTLRDHLRIHNDDKRYKCEHCGQAFVQKCSWKGHMKSKHGEIIV